jgi:hypothetical protein
MVSDNVKLAYALQIRDDLELGSGTPAGHLQLSNVKTTQDVSASAASQPVSVLLVLLYNAHSLPGEQNYKNEGVPAISLTKLRH